jgi:hypothetical protein
MEERGPLLDFEGHTSAPVLFDIIVPVAQVIQ